MKRIALALLALFLLAPALAQGPMATPASDTFGQIIAEASQAGWLQVKPDAAMQQIDAIDPFLLDVRNQSEWDADGHIAGALLVPVAQLSQNLDKLPADLTTPVIVYCGVGTRGNYGMLFLKTLGYTNVKNLAGGFTAWKDAGLPVATN